MQLSKLARKLKQIVGPDGVLDRREDVSLYEYDAGLAKGRAELVVLPRSTPEVSRIARLASEVGVAIVPRGAGTGLSGGSVPRQGGIVMVFSRMTRILEIDASNRRAVVEPGVVNLELSQATAKHGLYFAPDPSSQKASTIGGNVAENSGGPHTLLYGVTVNHVTGLEVVLADGRVVELGGKAADSLGYDLTGFFVGSEGTLGIVTRITVKLSPIAESVATLLAIFNTIDDAARTVTSLTAEGITPSALEMLDGWTLRTVEEATHAGYPLDSGAVLLIELEGLREEVEEQAEAVKTVCDRNHAREVRRAKSEQQRQLLWMGRKNAFAAIGRISPSYYTQDGVVPRTKIPEVLEFIAGVSEKYGLRIGNIFHAGDGNLHPAILFDIRDPVQIAKTHAAGADILKRCVEMGGSITGEHGVGMEKNELMSMLFSDQDLEIMRRLHDAFNPKGVLNPQKVFPTPRSCREGIVSRRPLPEMV
ncbi:MAG TPA: FAD-linked oxidase C-terminal domain-containing protein [Terriglobales bacterium]|nr:FAD-linked oxidase C-terminal domain-containing protein [Terriglobales bacterium]